MLKYLLTLEIKEMLRSPRFTKRLLLKLLTLIMFLYFALIAVIGGFGLYYGIKEEYPEQDAFLTGNNYVIYFLAGVFIIFLLMGSLPAMKIKPLMILPFKKRLIINYFLTKLQLNIFNLLFFILLLSYTIAVIIDKGNVTGALAWFSAILLLELSLIFIAYLMEKDNRIITAVFVFAILVYLAKRMNIVDIAGITGQAFYSVYLHPWLVVIPFLIFIAVYRFTYKTIKGSFYVDGILGTKQTGAKELNLSWLDRFGTLAVFLKNDIRMIIRNKRPRNAFLFSFYFLLYGYWVIYSSIQNGTHDTNLNAFRVLIFGMLMTGGFMFTFGNMVPSWDSEYYNLLMSQNIKYREYLESKWWLMTVSVIFFTVLSLPALFLSPKFFLLILTMAVFNIGFNSFLVLAGGFFNDKPIRLNEKVKSFQNTKSFNINSFIIGIIRLFLPVLIYYLSHRYLNDNAGLIILVVIGIAGILIKPFVMSLIEKLYVKRKYILLESFNKEE